MNERRLDEKLLVFASMGQIYCTMAHAFLNYCEENLRTPLDLLIQEHFDKERFSVVVHLDLPTSDDKTVKARLRGAGVGAVGDHHSIVWNSLSVILDLFFSATRLISELGLLVKVLSGQPDAISFAVMYLFQELVRVLLAPDWAFSNAYGSASRPSAITSFLILSSAWVAITNNEHYLNILGLERLAQGSCYKQEVIAGNLAEFLKVCG